MRERQDRPRTSPWKAQGPFLRHPPCTSSQASSASTTFRLLSLLSLAACLSATARGTASCQTATCPLPVFVLRCAPAASSSGRVGTSPVHAACRSKAWGCWQAVCHAAAHTGVPGCDSWVPPPSSLLSPSHLWLPRKASSHSIPEPPVAAAPRPARAACAPHPALRPILHPPASNPGLAGT